MQGVAGITKCNRKLLQNVAGIAKCGKKLLQSVKGITKCDNYYKLRGNNFHAIISSILKNSHEVRSTLLSLCVPHIPR